MDYFGELLNLTLQLLNLIRHLNEYNSITTRFGLVVRVDRVRVGAPLEAVPLGTKRDQEGTSQTPRGLGI